MKESLFDWIYNHQFGRIIITFFIGIAFGIIFYGTYEAHTQTQVASAEPETRIEYVYIEAEPEVITDVIYVPYEEPFFRNLTEEDKDALLDIAMREAEGEDVIGQALVMYVVICRAEKFGQSITQVVNSSAFQTSEFRAGKTPNENACKALALIEEGWTPKPVNFRRGTYHDFGTPLFQYGDHYFSY